MFFIIGDETEPELEGVPSNHRLRQRLLERCDHISEEVIVSLYAFFMRTHCFVSYLIGEHLKRSLTLYERQDLQSVNLELF